MREIKFRAYRPATGVMYPGLSLKQLTTALFLDDDVQMQYTGLKDKNGVEIYEGDILSIEDGSDNFVSVVDWFETAFTLTISTKHDTPLGCYAFGNQPKLIEVIGNIYENPELLKEVV